jgi:uncharacterized protein with gpF-like domain
MNSQYKKLYAQGLKTYSPQFKKELQKQVDEFCRTQDLNAISSKGLKKTLYSLHIAMGIKTAEMSYKSLKKTKNGILVIEQKGWLTDLWQNVITRYLDLKGLSQLVEEITNTTKEQIQRFLKKGILEGKPLQQTIKELKQSGITNYRAELIARTETGRAANVGSMIGAVSTGLKTNKIWISTLDARTRRIPPDKTDHLNMNGVEVPMDDRFEVFGVDGTELMLHPCDPTASAANTCNCRCTIGYKVVKDNNGDYITYQDEPPQGDVGQIWRLLTDSHNNDIYTHIIQALQ